MSKQVRQVPKTILEIAGFPELTLTVYGWVKASCIQDELDRGYHVSVDGKPTPPAELTAEQKAAYRKLLEEKFPEHARI